MAEETKEVLLERLNGKRFEPTITKMARMAAVNPKGHRGPSVPNWYRADGQVLPRCCMSQWYGYPFCKEPDRNSLLDMIREQALRQTPLVYEAACCHQGWVAIRHTVENVSGFAMKKSFVKKSFVKQMFRVYSEKASSIKTPVRQLAVNSYALNTVVNLDATTGGAFALTSSQLDSISTMGELFLIVPNSDITDAVIEMTGYSDTPADAVSLAEVFRLHEGETRIITWNSETPSTVGTGGDATFGAGLSTCRCIQFKTESGTADTTCTVFEGSSAAPKALMSVQRVGEIIIFNIIKKGSARFTRTNNEQDIDLGTFDLTLEKVKDIFDAKYDETYFLDGFKGLARFVKNHLLKTEKGETIYACFDSSRCIFKYKNEDGSYIKDIEATKLVEIIHTSALAHADLLANKCTDEYFNRVKAEELEANYDTSAHITVEEAEMKSNLATDSFLTTRRLKDKSKTFAKELMSSLLEN